MSLSPLNHEPITPPIGSIVSGHYEILVRLGEGGMGSVFKAKDLVLNREVAIKFLLPNRLVNSVNVRRFHQEAQATARLDHPGIVRVHDINTTGDGLPFLVMDLVSGKTLAERISHEGQLPVDEVLDIFIVVCDALAHAHKMGVLHRDIKPSNIMVATYFPGNYGVKVLDFGLAKIIATAAASGQELTQTGQTFGTPYYMSPEQALGKKVDHRADIYSLGCTLYEALTAAPPHLAETAYATVIKHETDVALKMSEAAFGRQFPEELEGIVAKLLAKKAEERYQSMAEVKEALLKVKGGSNLEERTPIYSTKSSHPRPKLIAVGLLTLALVVGVVGFGLLFRHSNRKLAGSGTAVSQTDTETLKSMQKAFSDDNKKSAQDFAALADAQILVGDAAGALVFYDGALATLRAESSPGTLEIATVMNRKGLVLMMCWKLKEAEVSFRNALSIYTEIEPNGKGRYETMLYLADACSKQNKLPEAEKLINTALNYYRTRYGSQSPELACCLGALGRCHLENQKYQQAETELKEALQLTSKTLGPDSDSVFNVERDLAHCYSSTGKFVAAESIWSHQLKVQRAKPENPMALAAILLGLGKIYATEKQCPAALRSFDEAIKLMEHTPAHGTYLEMDVRLRMAKVLIALKRNGDAEQVTRDAVSAFLDESQHRIDRHQYEKSVHAFFVLAKGHQKLGNQSEAESELKQARMIYRLAQPFDQSE